MTTDRFAMPDEHDARKLRQTMKLMDVFRSLDPAIPASYIVGLLAVASEPGKGVTHYAEVTGMLRPVASRVLLEMGKRTRTGGPGFGLVDSVHGSVDLRAVNYFVTAKGELLLARVMAALEEE